MSGPIRLGTQGWTYPDWVGPFLPEGSRPPRHLTLYASAFDTVEVDSTFYALPTERTVRSWVERSRPGFVFSLKLPREITHDRRLRDAARPLSEFIERVRLLEDRLGPLLIQLGPDFAPTEEAALFSFLDLLPADLHFAVEFRQRGWITGSIHERMKETGIPPSFDEMKDALDLRSKSGIHRLITALEERGFIRRLPNRARALEVVKLLTQRGEHLIGKIHLHLIGILQV